MFSLTLKDFPQGLLQHLHPTGSKYICDPPVLTTDEDYYACSSLDKEHTVIKLIEHGWTLCTENEYDDDTFVALRKGSYNLILLLTYDDWHLHVLTTELAKRFNLVNKQDRVDLFELVRNGSY